METRRIEQVKIFWPRYYSNKDDFEEDINNFIIDVFEKYASECEINTSSDFIAVSYFKRINVLTPLEKEKIEEEKNEQSKEIMIKTLHDKSIIPDEWKNDDPDG